MKTLNLIKQLMKRLMTPTLLPYGLQDLLTFIPRIICGGLLAFSFGSDKFGMPWTATGVELSLFEVAEWFPKDVAEFGGIFAMFPLCFAWMGAASEAIGGLFLLIGLQTRISSFLIACTMLVAIFFQKWGGPVWHMLPAMGFLWVAMIHMALGSGRFGLDYLLTRKQIQKSRQKIEVQATDRVFGESLKNNNERLTAHRTTLQKVALSLLCMSIAVTISAQINGNGQMTTKSLAYDDIEEVYINLYAAVTIDYSAKGIQIQAESNIIDYINVDQSGTALEIDQKKWIEPTKRITITIGAPDLQYLEHDTWDSTLVKNINGKLLEVRADIGTVVLQGKIENLKIKSKQGVIDAKDLSAKNADVKLSGPAEAYLSVLEKVTCDLADNSTLQYVNSPSDVSSCEQKTIQKRPDVKYIDLTIKNNSWTRKHFVVVGPKPDGRQFSYGFPMMPGQKKKERWTTGTKIYKENALGMRTLLVTIDESDEGTVVPLHQKGN